MKTNSREKVSPRLISIVIFTAIQHLAVGTRAAELYQERLRPRFHFTADRGYLNDPNGLVYVDGTYHLFFQHDGFGRKKWGHATSSDLLHWRQLEDAIVPKDGFDVFSGSAVFDVDNTSGLGTEANPPIVAAFTSWGEGQCLAYSTDRGETFQRYQGNPVLSLPNDAKKDWPITARDPHLMWDAERSRWVMVLYDSLRSERAKNVHRHKQGGFSIFTSTDLKQWKRRSHVPGFYVCPDVIELPIEDEAGQTAWVAMDWEKYAVGEFNGVTFLPETELRRLDFGTSLSANQSWKHLPDGRTIQIAWVRGGQYPGMPFDQQLSFPTTLSLRRIDGELRLCKRPIKEIETLYTVRAEIGQTVENLKLAKKAAHRFEPASESYDLGVELPVPFSGALEIKVLGHVITLREDSVTALGKVGAVSGGLREIRILADVTTVEIFANRGELTMTFAVLPTDETPTISVRADQAMALPRLKLRRVGSIWNE